MSNIQTFPLQNGYAPKDGPRGLPLNIDWTSVASQPFDFVDQIQNGDMTLVQAAWIDNADVNQKITLTFVSTGQRLIVPANVQGFFPILSGSLPRFTASIAATEAHTTRIIFTNIPPQSGQWGP